MTSIDLCLSFFVPVLIILLVLVKDFFVTCLHSFYVTVNVNVVWNAL